jgi:predicted Ser/Thr protein kinase
LLHGIETAAAPPPKLDSGTSSFRGIFIAPPPADLAQHFPQLEILDLLGQGGMGAVYKARQPGLDRLVAVKILPPEAGIDAAFAERFTREARALARLNHPNIITVYDFGQTKGLYYFIMEYVDGVNLRQLLRSGRIHPEEALKLVPQICDALQYAHDEKFVHRDIKPENILLDKKGRVKIADFGIAKLLGRTNADYTLTGPWQVMGTLHYMAPEQMDNPLKVDHRADIYALGVVFYEMLTGQLPLGRFAPPSQKVQVDVRLDEVVLRALESEPQRRYQQAREVKTDVEAITIKPVAQGAQGRLPYLATRPEERRTPVRAVAGRESATERLSYVRPVLTRSPGCLYHLGRMFTILVCVAGLLPLFFTWFRVYIEAAQPLIPIFGGGKASGTVLWKDLSGYQTWQGLVTAIPSFLLGCTLIASATRYGIPRWRPLVIILVAFGIAGVSGYTLVEQPIPNLRDEYEAALGQMGRLDPDSFRSPTDGLRRMRAEGLIRFGVRMFEGPYISLALATLLLLVGSYELRLVLQASSEQRRR